MTKNMGAWRVVESNNTCRLDWILICVPSDENFVMIRNHKRPAHAIIR